MLMVVVRLVGMPQSSDAHANRPRLPAQHNHPVELQDPAHLAASRTASVYSTTMTMYRPNGKN